jgi:hypothetical protein
MGALNQKALTRVATAWIQPIPPSTTDTEKERSAILCIGEEGMRTIKLAHGHPAELEAIPDLPTIASGFSGRTTGVGPL